MVVTSEGRPSGKINVWYSRARDDAERGWRESMIPDCSCAGEDVIVVVGSDAELGLQEVVDRLRVGLAA